MSVFCLCFHLRSHSCAAWGHDVLQILHSSFLKLLFLPSIPRICVFIQQQREPELRSQTITIKQNSLAGLKGGKDRGREGEGERCQPNYLQKQPAELLSWIARAQKILLHSYNISAFFQNRNVHQQQWFCPSVTGKNFLNYLFQIA